MNLENIFDRCTSLDNYDGDPIILAKLAEFDLKCEIKSGRLLVFTESWCVDCKVNVTVLKSILEYNSADIKSGVLPREGNEALLMELTGATKIPSFIFEDSDGNRKVFIERPKSVTDLFMNNQREIKVNMDKYKQGEFLKESIDELCAYLKDR